MDIIGKDRSYGFLAGITSDFYISVGVAVFFVLLGFLIGYLARQKRFFQVHGKTDYGSSEGNGSNEDLITEQRYMQLVEHALVMIAVIYDDKWVYMNDMGIKMLKAADKKDVLHKNIYNFIHEKFHESCRQGIETILNENRPVELMEQEWLTVEGNVIYVEAIGLPITYHNKPAIQFIVRDINDRKQAEQLMVNSEKLSIAGKLAAGIAHEIRNPLTSIKGFLQLLESEMKDTQRNYFNIIWSELNRIEWIVSELLILAKPQTKNIAIRNIRSLIDQVATLMGTEAIMNNVEIKTTFDSDAFYVRCDENQLKQVFINLIKNAIEAMPDGGKILLDVKKWCDDVVVRISDEGCGIPEKMLDKVGQPFFTTKKQGTGLGLMVSFSIIEHHEGNVTIHSREGQGTTFIVRLPDAEKQRNQTEKEKKMIPYEIKK